MKVVFYLNSGPLFAQFDPVLRIAIINIDTAAKSNICRNQLEILRYLSAVVELVELAIMVLCGVQEGPTFYSKFRQPIKMPNDTANSRDRRQRIILPAERKVAS